MLDLLQRIDNRYNAESKLQNPNLIIWFDANLPNSYPYVGDKIYDLSGNNHTHILSDDNMFKMLDGVNYFDCTKGVIRAESTNIKIPYNFTYIVWARLFTHHKNYRTLLRTYDYDAGHPIMVYPKSNLLGMWENYDRKAFNSSGFDVSAFDNVWAQYVTVGDNKGQQFYINSHQVGKTVDRTVSKKTHFAVGNIQTHKNQPWGHVASLKLYNFKLSLEQIRINYAKYKNVFTI